MGQIETILAATLMDEVDILWENKLRIEWAAEGVVHVHWHDCRLIMDEDQFSEFVTGLDDAYTALALEGIPEGSQDIALVAADIPAPLQPEATVTPGIVIELQKAAENAGAQRIIHIHYHDLRIEMTMQRFLTVAEAFNKAKRTLLTGKETMVTMVNIDPYDHIHKPTVNEWIEAIKTAGHSQEFAEEDFRRHVERVQLYKDHIMTGYQINPIIVTKSTTGPLFKRRDGYCRFMAYQSLGMKMIPCYVVSEDVALAQPQHGAPAFRNGGIL